MKIDKFNIVIVDDNMRPHASFRKFLEKNFPEAEVELYTSVKPALDKILSNLAHKTIVFMDCMFDFGEQGFDGLREIRKKTSLISIVMMTAKSLHMMDVNDIALMINTPNIYFIRNNNINEATNIVKTIIHNWNTRIDCMLEQWVMKRIDSANDMPYVDTENGMLSLNDILFEIRNRTEVGQRLEQNIQMLSIDLLTRDNVKPKQI